jgi:hypothetical protein
MASSELSAFRGDTTRVEVPLRPLAHRLNPPPTPCVGLDSWQQTSIWPFRVM